MALDASLHGGDVGGDHIHPMQHLRQQKGVTLAEPAGQRLGQPAGLGAQATAGQLGEHGMPLVPGQATFARLMVEARLMTLRSLGSVACPFRQA
ncbi:hypothetical protein, partial [Modestobacter marinus]|uniref:hypothetical protein n=1 Tax=Modestobacter marinus TaxID=477641 RepID=UPI001C9850B3